MPSNLSGIFHVPLDVEVVWSAEDGKDPVAAPNLERREARTPETVANILDPI